MLHFVVVNFVVQLCAIEFEREKMERGLNSILRSSEQISDGHNRHCV